MAEATTPRIPDKEEELEEKEEEIKNKAAESNKLLKKIMECEEQAAE